MKKFKVLVKSGPQSENLLREFKNIDKKDVIAQGDDFTVSFEFELEYSGERCKDSSDRETEYTDPCEDESEREYQEELGREDFDINVLSEEMILGIMEEIAETSPPMDSGAKSAFGHEEQDLLKFAIDNLFSKVDWRDDIERNSSYTQGTLDLNEGKVLEYFQTNFNLLEDFWKKYGQFIEKKWNRNSNETTQIFEQFFEFVDAGIERRRDDYATEYWQEWCQNQVPEPIENFDDDNNNCDGPNYDEQGEEYLEEEFRQYFPRFYRLWSSEIIFTHDGSLSYGTEMKISDYRKYLEGIQETFQFLDDFYQDYDNQNMWKMNKKTGLHTNVGFSGADAVEDWNPLKGLLFLSYDFANKGWDDRKGNYYTKDLKARFIEVLKNGRFGGVESNVILSKSPQMLVNLAEGELNKILQRTSEKYFGFNITKIGSRHPYIEFRMPGGKVAKDDLKNAVLYYAYIVKLCTDPGYKHEEYTKKLTGFLVEILEDLKVERQRSELQYRKRTFIDKKKASKLDNK